MRNPALTSAPLPELLHDALRFRSGDGSMPPWQVPRSLREWLLDAGSLTRRLVTLTQGDFRVQVLRQGFMHALPAERRELGLDLREWPFVREVLLRCHDEPWVFARTLIPATSLQGRVKALTHLGTKPLGAVLFMASDSLLAWDRFGHALPWSALWVLGTYYPAIGLIASSVRVRSTRPADGD